MLCNSFAVCLWSLFLFQAGVAVAPVFNWITQTRFDGGTQFDYVSFQHVRFFFDSDTAVYLIHAALSTAKIF